MTTSPAPRPFSALDTALAVVEDDVRLQSLLAAPPAGHGKNLQPDAWYEAVFDLLACTHPETCQCPTEERS
jgi:hypothetical protein